MIEASRSQKNGKDFLYLEVMGIKELDKAFVRLASKSSAKGG